MSEPKRYQPVVQCVEPSYQAQMIEPKVMEFSEGEYVLHSDYARLKAEVERLRFAEDLLKDENQHLHKDKEQPLPDGWNSAVAKACDLLAEKEKEIARLKAECQARQAENSVLAVECDSLKAEVERLTADLNKMTAWGRGLEADKRLLQHWNTSDEVARLKAEVERLTSDIQMEKENEDRLVREWQKANNEVYGLKTQVAALIDDQTRLKAEVERLTKAGDKAFSLWSSGDESDADNFKEAIWAWTIAKKGGQP